MKKSISTFAVALAAVGGMAVFAPGSSAAPVARPGVVVPHGDSHSALLPSGWRVTPAGTPVALPGDLPLAMQVSPDGKYLLTVTGGYHDEDIDVIDMATAKLVQSLDVNVAWAGMCFDPSGKTLYVASGQGYIGKKVKKKGKKGEAANLAAMSDGQTVMRFSFENGRLTATGNVPISDLQGQDRWTAGLAMGADGSLFVTETVADCVYKLSGPNFATQAKVAVGYRPYACALSTDGKTLAVSNWGDQSVSLIDPATMKEISRVPVGSHPNQLVWDKLGRLFVACAGSNAVSVVKGGKVVETIKTSLRPNDPVGSQPDALALAPNGRILYVANADNNDVAEIDVSDPDESVVRGFIPTGWYPSALAVAPDNKKIYIATGKGLFSQANSTVQTSRMSTSPYSDGRKYAYIPSLLNGTVSVVAAPDAATLAGYTNQVTGNFPSPGAPTADDAAILAGAFHKIKHVLYIIRENRTYDEEFGDIAEGNGDPSLVLFNKKITPNSHALAAKYVLLDNLYCNGEVSESGHQWCDSAYATDYIERAWVNSYSGRGDPKGDDRLSASPAGFLWDNCNTHGVTYYSYGEKAGYRRKPGVAPVFTGSKGLTGHASEPYSAIPWFAGKRDLGRAAIFISDLKAAEATGNWPQFTVMSLPEDHTQGLKAGAFSPFAHVAENDDALGEIVDAVSHSKFWPETAIFVIEDDAQNGPDHVDAHRTVGLVISPYVRKGVDSTMYSTSSYVRTMELILGLPPMTQYDKDATPLYNSFTTTPDFTPYTALPPNVDLKARNPKKGAGAVASDKMDFSAPDLADPDKLNLILWHALKPGIPMPAPVRSARLSN